MPAISSTPETALATTFAFDAPPQGLFRDPAALLPSWRPPRLLGRDELVASLEMEVLPQLAPVRAVVLSLTGPRGAGTSALAARLIEAAKARLTRPGAKGVPLILKVDASGLRTPCALVSALFRALDPDFSGRGASSEFLSLLLLRRLRTLSRPAVLWLDQAHTAGEAGRVVRSLARPEAILPEGPAGLPPMLLVASGPRDAVPEEIAALRSRLPALPFPHLAAAVQRRASLAFQRPPSRKVAEAITNISIARGWGLSRVGDLLTEAGRRAEARDADRVEVEDVAAPEGGSRSHQNAVAIDTLILEILRSAAAPLTVAGLKGAASTRCREEGLRLPGPALLWRHLVGLERRGLVVRDVRIGGPGGSSTRVSLREGP